RAGAARAPGSRRAGARRGRAGERVVGGQAHPARGTVTSRRVGAGLLLTPGASADRNQATLVAIDKAVRALGIEVARVDLPSRPGPAIEAVKRAAADLAAGAGVSPERVALGGRSFGVRLCS